MKITKRTTFIICLSIYIITLFLGVNTFFNINVIDKFRSLLNLILPLSIILSILFDNIKCYKKNSKIFNNKIPLVLYFLTIIWFFISFLVGIRTGIESLKGLAYFIILLTLLITLFYSKFEKDQIKQIKKSIFISFMICMLYGIIQYVFKINLNTYNNDKYPGIFGRINSTCYIATVLDKYIVIMFPLLTYELIKGKHNAFFRILLVLTTLGVTFTFSRSGQLIFLIMAFIFFIVTLSKKQFINSILMVILVATMILIPGAKYSVQSALDYAYDTVHVPKQLQVDFLKILGSELKDVNAGECVNEDCVDDIEGSKFFRDYYENIGKQFIKEYPVFGIGIGNESYLYNNQNAKDYLKDDSVIIDEIKYMYPHSGYVQLTAETGYVGFILFALTILSLGFYKLKSKSDKMNWYVIPLVIFALIMSNFTEGIFHTKQVMYLFAIAYAIYTNCNLKEIKHQ